MPRFGYTLMTEQSGPRELVRYAQAAEDAGFDFEVMSDHYFPWLDEQGHAGYAWSMLGAVTQVTRRVELMTYVTCPIVRYHPAVVAQKASTIQVLSDGRFTLGLGAGENLNEHVVGEGWPPVNVRHEMLEEAVTIIAQHSHESADIDELMSKVARGDSQAFDALYDQVSAPVYGLARRVVRDPTRAEDVTQEVFLEVWRKAARFDRSLGKAKTWTMTIAHRRAVDAVRRSES